MSTAIIPLHFCNLMLGASVLSELELEYCEPEDISCPEFVSGSEKFSKYFNNTWSLASGGQCTVKVDATTAVARVIFDNTSYLGIEMEGA